MNPDLIKPTIDNLPNMSDDELVHLWKCCSSYSGPNAKQLQPLTKAIDKQRKLNGKARTIEDSHEETNINPETSDSQDLESLED